MEMKTVSCEAKNKSNSNLRNYRGKETTVVWIHLERNIHPRVLFKIF